LDPPAASPVKGVERTPKTPTLLKPNVLFTRKSQTSHTALKYWSGIIQQCAFFYRKKAIGSAIREVVRKWILQRRDVQAVERWVPGGSIGSNSTEVSKGS
jgi:hypothetical protein